MVPGHRYANRTPVYIISMSPKHLNLTSDNGLGFYFSPQRIADQEEIRRNWRIITFVETKGQEEVSPESADLPFVP